MKSVLIVGAGQLGSRHLQALRSIQEPLAIQVIDPSPEALNTAKERYNSIPGVDHPVEFHSSLDSAKKKLDLVINASSARARRGILEKLLEKSEIKYLVLEKILFTAPEDYVAIEKLVNQKATQTWVNCCMRQMLPYRQIQKEVTGKRVHMTVTGSQYGLVTNAIHYFDYLAWLAGSSKFKVSTDGLDNVPIPSKRPGYLELNGTLTAQFENGCSGTVTCFPSENLPILVEIHSPSSRFIVRESERKLWTSPRDSSSGWSETDVVIPYQSQLTAELARALFESGRCALPTLKESIDIHLSLLNPLCAHLEKNKITTEVPFPFT